jgi:hypothetical protein
MAGIKEGRGDCIDKQVMVPAIKEFNGGEKHLGILPA